MSDITLVNLAADVMVDEPVMPLGSLSLKATLEKAGYDVDFRDIQLMPDAGRSSESLAELFETDRPVLGISLMADHLAEVVVALRIFKSRHPNTPVVLGGAGPTAVAEALVRTYPTIDAVVRGEGERTILEVMSALRNGGTAALADVAGVTANADGRFVHNSDRPRVSDLDSLPSAHNSENRVSSDLAPYPDISLVTARGCPFRCSFCSIVTQWGRQVVSRSVSDVVDEIAWHAERKRGAYVHIEDDTFTLDVKRVHAFCDDLDRRGVRVEWGCNVRIDRVDESLVARMVASGCRSMFLGVEAGSDRVRELVAKKFTTRDVLDRIEMLNRYVKVTASFIWGYPFETLGEFHETFLQVAYLSALGVRVNYSHLVPYPRATIVQDYTGPYSFRTSYPFPRMITVDPSDPSIDEIRAHPNVFMQYYSMETPNEREKFDFVARFARFHNAS